MNFLVPEGTDLVGHDLCNGDGPAVKGGKLNLVAASAFIDVNHRPDVTHREPMLGEVGGERHAVQIFHDQGFIIARICWQPGLGGQFTPVVKICRGGGKRAG